MFNRFYKFLKCCFVLENNNIELNNFENKNITENYPVNVPFFELNDITLKCLIIDVYDGDTVTCVFPFLGTFFKEKIRLYGVDCPEIRTKNVEEKINANISKDFVKKHILNKYVYIDFKGKEKYGRHLGIIKTIDVNCINDEILLNNLGIEYFGGKKK